MQKHLLQWYDLQKRDLPWRDTRDPYAIWVSEIMLQQTRAETVTRYWTSFLAQFPTLQALAAAPEQAVLKAWEGLGYYSRARNLQACAKVICAEHGGQFPGSVKALRALPGIGDYTAGALGSILFGLPVAAVDGNVERVVSRLRGIRADVGIPTVRRDLRAQADSLVPHNRPGDFNQAMMELGARVCQPVPRCAVCPIQAFCDAFDAGDADALPVKQRKAPPRVIPRATALVFHDGKVLLHRREEKLLHGLWVFPGFDGIETPEETEQQLAHLGITAHYRGALGEARHVFTHIIWEMTLFHFDAATPACPEGWRWADLSDLNALPMPTALRIAREKAVSMLL